MSAAIAGRLVPSDIPAPMPGGAHVRRRAPAWPRAAATALAALLLAASMALSHIFAVRLGLVLHPLDVPVMLQDPALPNGCEAVSLAAALDYAGVAADPLQGNLTLRTEEFLSCFEAMGSRALVVRPG